MAVHSTFVADRIDEVVTSRVVDMMEALPPEEAAFYKDEENVVDWKGKLQIVKEELELHYGCVGGSESEWAKYLHREDLPRQF